LSEGGGPAVALVTATSAELIGERPLPRLLRARPLLFIFGPAGCGKSLVAARVCGEGAVELDAAALSRAAALEERAQAAEATAAAMAKLPPREHAAEVAHGGVKRIRVADECRIARVEVVYRNCGHVIIMPVAGRNRPNRKP
jgi:hypothetical protein